MAKDCRPSQGAEETLAVVNDVILINRQRVSVAVRILNRWRGQTPFCGFREEHSQEEHNELVYGQDCHSENFVGGIFRH